MFANYTGRRGRSMSTTDVYHLGGEDNDDDEATARRSFSSLLRQQIRRPSVKPPPVPPKRTDSFGSSDSSDTATLARVRSYLSEDIRREFESTMARVDEEPRSPSSSNFVKKLVATLERRQKDGVPRSASPDIYKHSSFRELSRQDRNMIASPRKEEEDARVQVVVPPMDFSPRLGHLEELHEAENEEDEEANEAAETDSSDADDYIPNAWSSRSHHNIPDIVRSYPHKDDKPDPKSSNRRSLKNVFSSLINWRIGGGGGGGGGKGNLPKGSRDYYATRESLGEELRTFRRDTMPRLMEHAAVNSRLSVGRKERPRRDTQDFARLIHRASNARPPRPVASPQSLATIHPIYGACKASSAHLQVEPVVAPELPQPTTTTSPVISDEHLLRPSRLRDLQKRISREIESLTTVELRSSVATSMHYDVPKSNRPLVVQEYTDNPPLYQNIGQTVSQDERLSCTLFTTF